MAERPVVYLDIDDTILSFPRKSDAWWKANPGGAPADGVQEFLEYVTTHCEVRWLTFWWTRGYGDDAGYAELAERLRVPVALLSGIRNSMGWDGEDKATGIDFDEHRAGRPWLWIEDECLPAERKALMRYDAMEHWVPCNTSRRPYALRDALAKVKQMVEAHGYTLALEPLGGASDA